MSSKDDPFSSDGRTVVKPAHGLGRGTAGDRPTADPGTPRPPRRKPADPTVFDPKVSRLPPKGRATPRTVIAQDPPIGSRGDDRDKLSLDRLLEANIQVDYRTANPMLSAAAPVLMLLGHLRQAPIAARPPRLADHLAASMEEFDRKVAHAGIGESDARIARYVLCETVDDIVKNLPGFGQSEWMRQGMLSRFFLADAAGVGFFDALNSILADPEPHGDLLELIHVCLSLGFEGQYRGVRDSAADHERVRRDVYETLRYFQERPGEDISPQWQGVTTRMAKSRARVPLWAVAAAACALVAGAFVEMRGLVTDDGEAIASEILALDPAEPVTIQHVSFLPIVEKEPAPVPEPEPPRDAKLGRVRAALNTEIAAGKLTVEAKGQFIVVEINNLQLFQPGQATLKPEFDALVGPVAASLSAEPGPIRIVGHTDSEKPGRGSTFKSNFDLSVARAKAVEKLIAPKIGDSSRIVVEGKGEDEPIADNATPEGRARNRRVDLMISREETS